MPIAANIAAVRQRIARAAERANRDPATITIVAVAKTATAEAVRQAFEAGLRHFGENRVQEAERKLVALSDLRSQTTWHMVGTLQNNKAKDAIQLFDIMHSVDSVRLGERLARLLGRRMPVFLEVNVAVEATKRGLGPEDVAEACVALRRCSNLDLRGLMTIAPLAGDPQQARPVFRRLRELAEALGLPELSMGMTNDFEVAIEEGATAVRIGRAIFGE